MQEPIQQRLAEFVSALDLEKVPEHFKADARLRVLDWIGCAVAGADYPQMQIAKAYLGANQSVGSSSIVGTDEKVSARVAAFLNGIAGHVCELDDGHRTAIGHPGSITLPVAFALAEEKHLSGKDFLKAVIIGYDMYARLGRTVNPTHYRTWHATATCGTIAAAAAAASLLKLSAEQTNNALGLACTMAGGLIESFGTHAKAINIAEACQNGVDAASLAALGMTGSHSAILGQKGFVAATCTDPHTEHLRAPSEEGLISDTAFFKVYSSCGHTNSPLDMMTRICRKYAPIPSDIVSIKVKTYRVAVDLTAALKTKTEDEAKFSLPYCIAILLKRGSVTLENFAQSVREDPEVLRLASCVSVVEDPEATANFPRRRAEVTVTMKDGTVYTEKTLDACDEASAEQIIAKFRAAVPFYDKDRQDRIIELVMGIEALEDVSELTALLR